MIFFEFLQPNFWCPCWTVCLNNWNYLQADAKGNGKLLSSHQFCYLQKCWKTDKYQVFWSSCTFLMRKMMNLSNFQIVNKLFKSVHPYPKKGNPWSFKSCCKGNSMIFMTLFWLWTFYTFTISKEFSCCVEWVNLWRNIFMLMSQNVECEKK